MPGVSALNGRIEGDEKGGSLRLDAQKAALELPMVFAEPRLELEAFAAELGWKGGADGYEVQLRKAAFHNKDAAGEAHGTWRPLPRGPGRIDLDASLTRASAEAVWRYIPLTVGKDVRNWLHASVVGGKASEATLKLKGDLYEFPFRDGKDGTFEVRGKFREAVLRYAAGWPEIAGIDGELLFAGARMLITGKSARMFGVGLKDVRAEIAELGHDDPLLTVTGRAAGPTADFLRFIEASPVGERIDHFTEDMKAEGNGELDLKLALPLRRIAHSKVDGSYRFDGNRLTVDADLPPLTDVRGALQFSAEHLEARGIRAAVLGSPLSVDIRTGGDGSVQVGAAGEINVANLRRQHPHPALDYLSGSTKWNGTVRVRKKSAEVRIASSLLGLSSSLPEPFNKPATEALAFSLERKPPPEPPRPARGAPPRPAATAVPQDMLDIALGRAVRFQLVRRHDASPPAVTRGLLALGEVNATLPERGMLVAVNLPRVNADFWRGLLADARLNAEGQTWPALQFDLRSADLTAMDKAFHDVRIAGSRAEGSPATRFELKSRELAGNFEWTGSGGGRLSGRIAQFAIPESAATPAALQARTTEVIDRIPALDITVDQLSFKERPLGSVHLAAENREGYWNAKLEAKNEDGSF